MRERLTIRVSTEDLRRLTALAQQRGGTVSDVLRCAFQVFLDGQTPIKDHAAHVSDSPPSTHTLKDCAQALLAELPPHARARLEEYCQRPRYALEHVVPVLLEWGVRELLWGPARPGGLSDSTSPAPTPRNVFE